MNRVLLAAALATTSFVGVAAIAQTAPAPADQPRAITRAEALAQADRRFDQMDTNKDGKLSPDELRPMRGPAGGAGTSPAEGAAPPPPPPAGAPAPGGRMFARLDTNGDGFIDRNEFRAQAANRFDRMDTNKDGTIDAAERQAARAAMGDRPGSMRGMRGGGTGGDTPPPPPPPAPDPNAGQ